MTIMSSSRHLSKEMLEHCSHARMDAKRRAIEALSSTPQTEQTGQILSEMTQSDVTDDARNAALQPATKQ